MTRKQALFLLLINAVVSTLISVAVALLVVGRGGMPARIGPPEERAGAQLPPATSAPLETTETAEVPAGQGTANAAEPIVYVVEPGDTLSSLSIRFDVPVADIIAANQIPNPDYLPAGAELMIPVGGAGLPAGEDRGALATWTPIPTTTNTPLPFEPPSAHLTAAAVGEPSAAQITATPGLPATGEQQVEIAEIVGVGEIQQERAVISNVGNVTADLDGWSLSDDEGNKYWFPDFRLWAQASVAVDTRVGRDGEPPLTLYWGMPQAMWSIGEVATLKNAAGDTVAVYPIR